MRHRCPNATPHFTLDDPKETCGNRNRELYIKSVKSRKHVRPESVLLPGFGRASFLESVGLPIQFESDRPSVAFSLLWLWSNE